MRTETEMMNLILQIANALNVNAVALSGSRINQKVQTDEFQDYDVVYVVDDLENLTSDLTQTRFFKGMDASYYYEGYNLYQTGEL
jgi:aminoglycoside adenylyltransferase